MKNKIIEIYKLYKNFADKNEPYSYQFIFRPIANFITKIIGNIVSANFITYFRFFLCLLIFSLLMLCKQYLFVAALYTYLFNCILDCVDGNIARYKDTATYWGKFIDGYVDCLLEVFILVFGTIFLFLNNQLDFLMALIMIIATFLFLIENYTRDRLSFYREWIKTKNNNVENIVFFTNKQIIFMSKTAIDLKIFLIFLCLFYIPISTYLLLLAYLTIFISLIRIIYTVLLAHKNLTIHRVSEFKKIK